MIYEICHYSLSLRKLKSLRRSKQKIATKALNQLRRLVWAIIGLDLLAVGFYAVAMVFGTSLLYDLDNFCVALHINASVYFYCQLRLCPVFKLDAHKSLKQPEKAQETTSDTIIPSTRILNMEMRSSNFVQ